MRIRIRILVTLQEVFRIQDILVRIQILESVHLTSGSGSGTRSGSGSRSSDFQDANKKYLFQILLAYYRTFFVGTFT
jgi:hypothetical protein